MSALNFAQIDAYKEAGDKRTSALLEYLQNGKAVEAARNALLLDLSIEQIKSITGLSEEEIQNISNK